MFVLITGGSGSGKSEYAENLAVSWGAKEHLPLYYVATMEPWGEEGRRRILRHQKLREGKGFETIECYRNLEELKLPSRGVVLLECLSNLAANEMFAEDGAGEGTLPAVVQGVRALRDRCCHLAAVTNDIFCDGAAYDETTEQYRRCLGEINAELSKEADQVTEVVCGILLHQKEAVNEPVVEQL